MSLTLGTAQATNTICDLLTRRAKKTPEAIAITFLEDGETREVNLTFAEFDRRARAVAAVLVSRGAAGERIILLHAPGIEYSVAFWGIVYAGATAVPVYPPDPARIGPGLSRIQAVAEDARSKIVLTSSEFAAAKDWVVELAPQLGQMDFIVSDTVTSGSGSVQRTGNPDAPAFIQYTSGSTGTPKGVVVGHDNVLSNLNVIHNSVRETESGCAVLWLPPYHDMGLLNQIYSVAVGMRCVLLTPQHFLAQPARWLRAISRYRATYSGGPNFGFDLVARKCDAATRSGLDLSTWRAAFNGAEPIRAETLRRFSDVFGPSGFSFEAFLPCYGLAEATVCVTGKPAGAAPLLRDFDAQELARGKAMAAGSGDGDTPAVVTTLVSCGRTGPDHCVRVVDPETGIPAHDGAVAEIWFSGASVAHGYFGRSSETGVTFGATLDSGEGPFLKTGDLGFSLDGELYITGRLKDLIVIRGRNHYPHDIEMAAEHAHPAVRAGCSVATTVDAGGEAQLVVIAELNPSDSTAHAAICASVRQAVWRAHDVRVHAVALIERRALPKTSSGKVQRAATRAAYLAGLLPIVHSWEVERVAPTAERDGAVGPGTPRGGATSSEIEEWVVDRAAKLLGVSKEAIGIDEPISNLGLDSLGTVELVEDLGLWLGRAVPLDVVWSRPTIRKLVEMLEERDASPGFGAKTASPTKASAAAPFSFYEPFEKDEYRERTNKHYALPARFFEVLTGGQWHTYSGNVWDGIPSPDPENELHQTRSQEQKLDRFAELLELKPGQTLLDVGSGWGGPLIYMCKKYGVRGHGVALSPVQVEYARSWALREGVDCLFELKDWQDLEPGPRFDGIMTDEVIVHFFHLDAFFHKAFTILRDGGVLVNKELHFAHSAYAKEPDSAMRFIGNLYGNVCSYRTLAEELGMAMDAAFRVEEIRQVPPSDYFHTAAAWHANIRRHEAELVELVGAEVYASYVKYLVYVMLSPGGKTSDPLPLYLHYVKCRKPPEAIQRRLGMRGPVEKISTPAL